MNAAKRVLIVDDEPVIRSLCRRILAGRGYDLRFAAGLAEARAALRAPEALALLVTDIKLPDGNGLDLAAEVRADRPAVNVLVMTGSLDSEADERRLQELGLHESVLLKPFDSGAFERAVSERTRGG